MPQAMPQPQELPCIIFFKVNYLSIANMGANFYLSKS